MGTVFKQSAVSHQQITSLSASTSLTLPASGARGVYLQAVTQGVYVTFDGTAAASNVGALGLSAGGSPFYWEGDLSKVRVLETAASATLNVLYTR